MNKDSLGNTIGVIIGLVIVGCIAALVVAGTVWIIGKMF